jgi:hexokinase
MIILALISLNLRPIFFNNLIGFNLVIGFALSYPVLSIGHGLLEKQAIHMLFAGIIDNCTVEFFNNMLYYHSF